jgi:hypothetical protein
MDHDLLLLLTGAGIALIGGVLTSSVQHVLSLREDRIKRAREREDKEAEKRRELLMAGAGVTVKQAVGKVQSGPFIGIHIDPMPGARLTPKMTVGTAQSGHVTGARIDDTEPEQPSEPAE